MKCAASSASSFAAAAHFVHVDCPDVLLHLGVEVIRKQLSQVRDRHVEFGHSERCGRSVAHQSRHASTTSATTIDAAVGARAIGVALEVWIRHDLAFDGVGEIVVAALPDRAPLLRTI